MEGQIDVYYKVGRLLSLFLGCNLPLKYLKPSSFVFNVILLNRRYSLKLIYFQNVPALTEIPSPAARGYLWRLSTKRMVYTHDWKRKYFVLTGDKLYYYDNDLGDGSGGAGVIHLECFLDCVEAPLTDHKKATNVFILLAKERGLFEQVKLNITLHFSNI